MKKLLLLPITLFIITCDSGGGDNITEVFIDSVCGYDDFEYLAGRGDNCASPSYIAEDIANMYCELAGYTSAIQYDVLTSTTQQNVLAWYGYPYNDIQAVTCDNIGYQGNIPGQFGPSENCPIISNLVCE